jgi:hypothetical protein
VHQRTGRYQLRQRATLVLLCHEPPLVANTEAAACVHRHPHSVRLWRRRWAHGTVVLEDESGRGPQPRFSPLDHAVVQAIACAVVDETARLLRRPSLGDLPGRACRTLSRPISRSTVWRRLHADAPQPWRDEYWIFPRDLQFAEKAAVVRDLYAGVWEGHLRSPRDHLLRADAKTSLQARLRCHPRVGPAPGRPRRVEVGRGGARQYLAAWDVGRG